MQAVADDVVPPDRPGCWTHALMDLGATARAGRDARAATSARAQPWCRYAASAERPSRRGGAVREPPPRSRPPSRWLRGRIVERLRDAPNGELGRARRARSASTTRRAVDAAARGLERDGVLDLGSRTRVRACPPAPGSRHDRPVGYASPRDARHRPFHARPPPPARCPPTTRPSSRWTCAACAARWAAQAALPRDLRRGDDRHGSAGPGARRARGPAHGARRDRGRGRRPGARRGPRTGGGPARSSSCAARATTAATATWPPAAWRWPGRSSSRSWRPTRARPGRGRSRNWDRIARDAGIAKVHLPVARDVAMFGKASSKAAVIVDALLGTGVRGVLREPIRTAVEVIVRAGREASRSWPSTRRPPSTSRAASRRTRRSGPT